MKKTRNQNLVKAKKVKDDEFYTLYSDVEDFLAYYGNSGYFKGKTVHLPCDSVESNFYKYLKDNYVTFGIKEIIATAYNENGGTIARFKDGKEEVEKVEESMSYLEKESQEISLRADLIMSNPPFSTLSTYMPFLLENKKDFILLSSLTKIATNSFYEISKNVGDKFFYYGLNLKFERPDGSLTGVPVMWVTNLKNEDKVIRKLTDVKPFDLVFNMRTPEGDPVYSCSQVRQLNNEIPGGKYVLAPITIMTYDFQDKFEFIGFTNDKTFDVDFIFDENYKKKPLIKNEKGEVVELYTRVFLKIKGR